MSDKEKLVLALAALEAALDELSAIVDADPDMVADATLDLVAEAIAKIREG